MTGERRRWGKAGQRLTAEEARAADARAAQRRETATLFEQRDYRQWAAGEVVPARITIALDSHGLDGPEVDEQCGAHEPDVDMWEAGLLYPTWDQLRLLAELTGCTPGFFMDFRGESLTMGDTSMRFHRIGGKPVDWRQPPLVPCFTPAAIAAMKASLP